MIAILSKRGPPEEAVARQMLAAAPHRGSCATLRVVGNCVVGVATRPDFTDATVSATGPVVAALSGRLDNASELYRSLTTAGWLPASRADADVVVAAFQAHGPDALPHLRGCFAGVVTDGTTLWAFRDHVGFRPLFYRDDARAVVAASESRQVVVGAGLREEPDLDVLERMLYDRMPSDTPAALKGVERLSQASVLVAVAERGVTVRRYWRPWELLESARFTPADLLDRFTELMAQAVARCLAGRDVLLLSGGVDSPAVAAFAAPEHRRRNGTPLGALSAVFPDLPAVDERPYIELVTEHLGMHLHTYRPRARALDDVDEWCRLLGTPVPIVSLPELAASHALAHQLGYRNILTGEFAEFAFGSPMHLVPHLVTRRRWHALAGLLHAERERGVSRRVLAGQVLQTFVPGRWVNRYLHWRRLDAPQRVPDWLDTRKVNEEPYRADLLPRGRDRWSRAQMGGLEGSTIMMEAEEVCAARIGVPVRRPFADVDLWELFLRLPAEVKCPDLRFKTLARTLLRGKVPDAVLDRRRKTFFDDHVMTQVDYPTLRRLLVEPPYRLPGVNYARLAQRIEHQDFNRFDWYWAKDLAQIHAFLRAW